MKKSIILFLVILMSWSFSKAQTPELTDSHLAYLFDRMDYWCQYCYNDMKNKKVDSLRNSSGRIYDFIETTILKYPFSLTAEFPQAKSKGLHYISSDDGMIRIYSWLAKMEGHITSPHYEYRDIAAFKTSDGGRKYHDISNGTEGAFCTGITTVHTKKNINVYFANYFTYRDGVKTEKIKAYAIIDNNIKEISSFINGAKNPKQLWCDFSLPLNQLRPDKSEIHFNKDKTKLFVPVVENKGSQYNLTGKEQVFTFNGFMYINDKPAK